MANRGSVGHVALTTSPDTGFQNRGGNYGNPLELASLNPKTILLSASSTKLMDPTSTGVKIVRWPGGKIGHLANMINDEELGDVDHLILVGGLNDISMDTRETKESSSFHIWKLYETIMETKPTKTSIVAPYVCPEQADYIQAREIVNARLRRMTMTVQAEGLDVNFHMVPEERTNS